MNLILNGGTSRTAATTLLVAMAMLIGSWGAFLDLNPTNEPVEQLAESDLSSASGRAPGDWVKAGMSDPAGQYGGSPTVSTSHTDSSGKTYLTGFLIGDVKFGSISITGAGQDTFVGTIDSSGNWGMIKSAGQHSGGGWSSGNAIDVDASGNIYVTGHYQGNVTFGNTQLISTTGSSGGDTLDIFVAKMDPTGNWLWAKSAGGPYESDRGNGIVADGSGGAYVVGTINTTGNFASTGVATNGDTDAFIAHLDSNQSWDWVRLGGGPGGDSATGVGLDQNGDLRVVGNFQGGSTTGAQFGSQNYNAVGSADLFISKMTSTGGWSWTETAGAPGEIVIPWGFDVEGTDAYMGGLYAGTANFGSQSITATASANNAYIAKIDGTGAWQWANSSSGAGLHFIGSVDASAAGVAVSGGFSSGQTTTATFGTTTLTGTYFEILAGVLDSSGNWLWVKSGGSGGDDGYYNWGTGGVGWLPSGDVVVVGHACQGMSSACTVTLGGNSVTITPGAYSTQLGLTPGVIVWKQASDSDGDGVSDSGDNCPLIANAGQADMDSDNMGDACDDDADGDGILNDDDDCDGPAVNWDSTIWADDIDLDGCRDIDEDDDDDQDGVLDTSDPCTGVSFKLNWTSNVVNDNDVDGCHDTEEDDDDDNDGIDDTSDLTCPRGYANWGLPDGSGGHTHNNSADFDSDGCHDDVEDLDDDNDGINELDGQGVVLDRCPKGMLGWLSDITLDHDSDGCRDSDEDWDDDNDGVNDVDAMSAVLDLCSPGATGWFSDSTTDRDGDGCRDLDEDDDDDGDGILDTADSCFVVAGWTSDALTDHDGDGCRDLDEDVNDDNDPVYDVDDDCPKGEVGWTDSDFDGDGCRDETEDVDDDADGVCDGASSSATCNIGPDLCAETPADEDVNADGCGMFTQIDSDSDGVYDGDDSCPTIAAVTGYDVNGDGCTDDSDSDGTTDDVDAFPNDATQYSDRDGDTWGDNPNGNNADQCPDTPVQWVENAKARFGCAWEEEDEDADGVVNGYDNCDDTEAGRPVDANGCSEWQLDADADGVMNAEDSCPDTGDADTIIEEDGCSHEQRLAAGDTDALLAEYGLILGIVVAVLFAGIIGMLIMLKKRGGSKGRLDPFEADSAQLQAGGYVAGEPATAAPIGAPAVEQVAQTAASYADLPPGGSYVTDAAGGTWYNAPDGSQWAMQGDGSFNKA